MPSSTLYLCGSILPDQVGQLHDPDLALGTLPVEPESLHDHVRIFTGATGFFQRGMPLTVTFEAHGTDLASRMRVVTQLHRERNQLRGIVRYSTKNPSDWLRTAKAFGLGRILCGQLKPGEVLVSNRFRLGLYPEIDQFVMEYLTPSACVHAALREGASVGELARRFGVTPSLMRRRLRQFGHRPRRKTV